MRRFSAFGTATSKSKSELREASLTGSLAQIAQGLSGNLTSPGVLGDGTVQSGNVNDKVVPGVTFQKPDVPALAVHGIGHTVYNWKTIDCKPGATIGRARRRPTREGVWLVIATGDGPDVDPATGKFNPPVVATIQMWGETGQEPRRARG